MDRIILLDSLRETTSYPILFFDLAYILSCLRARLLKSVACLLDLEMMIDEERDLISYFIQFSLPDNDWVKKSYFDVFLILQPRTILQNGHWIDQEPFYLIVVAISIVCLTSVS